MKGKRFLVGAILLVLAGPAWADWDPGMDFKMHYPQMPDPFGWDVNFTWPLWLADDWQCTRTGPVSDIHFWESNRLDIDPNGLVQTINVAIYSNLPVGPQGFSVPDKLLWRGTFQVGDPWTKVRLWPQDGDQGWLDPRLGEAVHPDHQLIWQVNITDIPDPFIQQRGEIYWLALSVTDEIGGQITPYGWKTSQDHFMDDAVWWDGTDPAPVPFVAQELIDPFTGESLDLAFVITPEPATLGLLALGGLVAMRRRRC